MSQGFRFEASFAGVRIDVLSTSTSHPRRVFPHEFPNKSGAETEDQGRGTLRITLAFLFIDRKASGDETLPIGDFQERFDEFSELVAEDPVRTLVHPYLGQIRCRIADFSTTGDGEGQAQIRCSASFVEEISETPVLDIVDSAIQATAGAQSVLAASVGAHDALAAQGLSSELPGAAAATAEQWGFRVDLTTRSVQLEMADLNARLSVELDTLMAGGDVDSAPILSAYTVLQYRLRKAAEAFSTTTPRIIEITTTGTVPLLAIAARFYGAREAERRFAEMLDLNPQLRTPGCVPPAVTLKAYSRTVRPQEFRQ